MESILILKIVIVICSFVGLVLTIYVRHKKKQEIPFVCPFGADCHSVMNSKYSKFFGIPIELLGMAYYAFIAVAYSLYAFLPEIFTQTVSFLIVGFSTLAFFFSVYLTIIQGIVIREWCSWCLYSAFITTIIFILAAYGLDIDYVSLLNTYKDPIIILHAIGAAIGVGATTVADYLFFRFLKDYKISFMEAETMKNLSQVIWFAIGLLVLTGLGLFFSDVGRYVESSKFIVKITILMIIILNGIFLNFVITPVLTKISFGEPHNHKEGELKVIKHLAFVSGALSLSSWYIVFVLGSIHSFKFTIKEGLLLYLVIVIVAIGGSQIFKYRMNYQRKKLEK